VKTPKHIIRGRGAQSNPNNRFEKNSVEHFLDDLPTDEEREALLYPHPKTVFKEVFPKTIFNKVTSPDLPLVTVLIHTKDVSMVVCIAMHGTHMNIGVIVPAKILNKSFW
jgi:hypothetical protein